MESLFLSRKKAQEAFQWSVDHYSVGGVSERLMVDYGIHDGSCSRIKCSKVTLPGVVNTSHDLTTIREAVKVLFDPFACMSSKLQFPNLLCISPIVNFTENAA